jgi:hypothetical protein
MPDPHLSNPWQHFPAALLLVGIAGSLLWRHSRRRHVAAARQQSVGGYQAVTVIVVLLFLVVLGLYLQLLQRPTLKETILVDNYIAGRTQGWVDTFVDVTQGSIIEASGSLAAPWDDEGRPWRDDTGRNRISAHQQGIGPEGIVLPNNTEFMHSSNPRKEIEGAFIRMNQDYPFGSLVGRIGKGGPIFFIGYKGVVPKSGRLFLSINYFWWARNGLYPLGSTSIVTLAGGFTYKISPPDPSFGIAFIEAIKPWQHVRLAGHRIHSSGTANAKNKDGYGPEYELFWPVDPSGWTKPVPEIVSLSKRLAPRCPYMSLVAKFKDGSFECLGDGEHVFPPTADLDVDLAVNDIYWDRSDNPMPNWLVDNEGGFIVRSEP